MKKFIAVATDSNLKIWKGHFGMAPFYAIFDPDGKQIEMRENPYSAAAGKRAHHDDPKRIVTLLNDCGVFIAKRMGEQSKRNLVEKMNVKPVIASKEIPLEAVNEFLKERT